MLKTSKLVNHPAVNRLVKLWRERYQPDSSPLALVQQQSVPYRELVKASSPEGRALTAAKLGEFLIAIKCQMATIQTNALYAYIPNIVDLNETKRLAHVACLVYQKLMDIYQHQPDATDEVMVKPMTSAVDSVRGSVLSWGIPAIEELATAIEPAFLELQAHHIATKDWRTLGFITTLLNFSNKLMPHKLTLPEQVLLKPYLKFVEEQVALPWQRVCCAAAHHQLDSPAFILVEQMFPASSEIAQSVYQRLVQLLPDHRSRRGGLDDPGITHSCLRDLEMFQAYLWLCVLEESLAPIEEELVDLSVMVMTGVDVKWEMVELWNQLLAEELLSRVTPSQRTLLLHYTQGLQQTFLKERDRFIVAPSDISVSSKAKRRSVFQNQENLYITKQGVADTELTPIHP